MVVQDQQVSMVLKVTQDPLEPPDLMGPRALDERAVFRETLDPVDQLVLKDSPETMVSLEHLEWSEYQDLLVPRVPQVHRVHQGLWGLVVLLVFQDPLGA